MKKSINMRSVSGKKTRTSVFLTCNPQAPQIGLSICGSICATYHGPERGGMRVGCSLLWKLIEEGSIVVNFFMLVII